jgi:glutaredoxin-like protein NrdH
MKFITVYTKPGCQPCKATKRWLDKKGVDHATVDVTENPDDLAAVKALGYEGVPVVIVSNGDAETDIHWNGFHPDNLARYALPSEVAA